MKPLNEVNPICRFDGHGRTREIPRSEIHAVYGMLAPKQVYVWPRFYMVTKSGDVFVRALDGYGGDQSELCVEHYCLLDRLHKNDYGSRFSHGYVDPITAWKDCSKPINGATKLNLDCYNEDSFGFKVKWLDTITICTVCLRTTDLKICDDEIALILRGRESITPLQIAKLDQASKDRYWFYGIHQTCNPRSSTTKAGLIERLKPTKVEERLIRQGYSKINEGVGTVKVLGDCWPSFAKLYRFITGGIKSKAEKERIIKSWVRRNPNRASTESARQFFKIAFGISNLNKYTHDINTKQIQRNHGSTKPRHSMLG